MKGEIMRRMSMEIIKDEGIDLGNAIKKEIEKDKTEEEDDYLVKTIGPFGIWQAVVLITVASTRAIAAWNVLAFPFLIPVVEFVCVKFSGNDTISVKDSTCYDNCLKYNYSSAVGRSIVEEFGLICRKAWMTSFAQSVMMIGFLFGVSFLGWLSDRFGRRVALLQSTFLSAVLMISLPFSPTYIIFCSIRFVIGIATGGTMYICIVYAMEMIGKRHSEVVGVCCLVPESLAQASLAGFAYFTANWHGFTLSYGVGACIIFVLLLFVPESPRWLVANGKTDEAIKVITSAANRNKLDTSHIQEVITKAVEDIKVRDREAVKVTYLDFFKSKTYAIRTILMFIVWLVMCMCFYGIYQYVTIIGFSPYLTVLMLGLIQIPFLPLSIVLNKKLGRRISSTASVMIIAVTMLILIFTPLGRWYDTMLGVIAYVSSNIFCSISYVHLSELFPTPMRNMSYGLVSSGAKIGAMVAPFVANMVPIWLPTLIFSVTAVLAALCCSALPETKGKNLKDTIDE